MSSLKLKLANLPQKPGVYVFKNSAGGVLYVGKAKNLKNRVRSYFLKDHDERGLRISLMKSHIADMDYTVVSSEVESLILENNLIKEYHPRYNVSMRDDKNYAFIKIDYESEIPQIYPVRKLEPGRNKNHFFGPYTGAVKPTLKLISSIFHLCRNKKVGKRPCFAYHLGRCPGVCIGLISLAEYKKILKQVEDFLKNRQGEVMKNLKIEMKQAARSRRFEKAAKTRDKIRYLEHLWQRQKIVATRRVDQDFLGACLAGRVAIVSLFMVRAGRLIHTEYFTIESQNSPLPEILEKFIQQYYGETSDLPGEIIAPTEFHDRGILSKTISRLVGKKIKIIIPKKGKKKQLLKLAAENAKLYFEREEASFSNQIGAVLLDLQKLLDLPVLHRIEGYDISNIQGTNPVGSMVVFTNGKPDKAQYRKFKINVKSTPDDFAMMQEMLIRRFKRITPHLTSPTRGEEKLPNSLPLMGRAREGWPTPDLIIIDGGKGQLGVGVKALQNYKLKIPIIGLAKRLEEIFLPGQDRPILLPPNNPVLFLLQRIRDEAHRFAITFYRGRHSKTAAHSRLDDIPGLGPVSRRKLIKKFGTVSGVRAASMEELSKIVNVNLAKKIKEQL